MGISRILFVEERYGLNDGLRYKSKGLESIGQMERLCDCMGM